MLSQLQSVVQTSLYVLFLQRVIPYNVLWLPAYIPALLFMHLIVSLSVTLPFKIFIYQRYISPLRRIPGPPPGLNNSNTWLSTEPSPPKLLEWLKACIEFHGAEFQGLMRYRGIGGSERILVASPQALKEVLVSKQYSEFDRPKMARKRIAIQAGDGLIASEGNVHKAQKRKLLPSLSAKAVRQLYPTFWHKAQELMSALAEHTERVSGDVEIVSWTSRAALDIIGVAAWGHDFEAVCEPNSSFLRSYSAMFDISGGGTFINALALVIPMSLAIHIPCPYNKRLKNALRSVRGKCEAVVQEKLAVPATKSSGKDILSLLIQGGVDDKEALVNQMMTMLAAGHDTSSLSLAWACYVLSKNQHVQTRLREELRNSNFPMRTNSEARDTEIAVVQGLPYLQAVAQEILRLYPAVPVTRRECLRESLVQGYAIPEGGHLVASGYVINRLPREWGPDAESFIPERWLDNDKDISTNSFAFASFSHGPRSCIGQAFARAEFQIFLAALVRNFQIELQDLKQEVDPMFGITMSPAGGINVRLRALER